MVSSCLAIPLVIFGHLPLLPPFPAPLPFSMFMIFLGGVSLSQRMEGATLQLWLDCTSYSPSPSAVLSQF